MTNRLSKYDSLMTIFGTLHLSGSVQPQGIASTIYNGHVGAILYGGHRRTHFEALCVIEFLNEMRRRLFAIRDLRLFYGR